MSLLQEDVFPQVKRFACDRCHSQKLRCPRSSSGSEAKEPCIRCQKAGVRCNTSATQKTGRPSKASKLQKSKESTPSRGSPVPDRLSEISRPNTSFSKNKRSSGRENERDISVDRLQSLQSGNQNLSTSPSNDTFMNFEGCCTPISRDEYSEFFDCNFETASPGTIASQDFSESHYPTPSSISTSTQIHRDQSPLQQSLDLYTDQTFNTFLENLPAEENMLFTESGTTINNPSFTMFDGGIRSAETEALDSIQQGPRTPESITQCNSSAPDIMMDFRDAGDNFSLNFSPHKRQSDALERHVVQISGDDQNSEVSHSKTLSRLQLEIHDCSERVIQQARRATKANNPQGLDSQSLDEALGILLSMSERFIELTSRIYGPITMSQTPSPRSSSEHQQSFFSNRPYSSSSTSSTDVGRQSTSRPLDSATFHLMLACHTQLLTAYDAILDGISYRLPNPHSMGRSGDVFSIGSFTVPNGTFLESLLHLQVISHQLHRLSTALHSHLLASRSPRPEESGSAHMRWGLCKARRMAPASMGDFAMEEAEEREAALQAKITKISDLARKPRML